MSDNANSIRMNGAKTCLLLGSFVLFGLLARSQAQSQPAVQVEGIIDHVQRLERELKSLREQLTRSAGIVAGGIFLPDGTVAQSYGMGFSVKRPVPGRYEVTFSSPFQGVPVVVAASEGGPQGSNVRVREVNSRGFVLEGRTYSGHALADTEVSFIAIRSPAN